MEIILYICSCAGAGPVQTGSATLPTFTETDEDCLNINIYVHMNALTDGGASRRVLSWIHGGTFNFGGVDVIYEDPAHLVDSQDQGCKSERKLSSCSDFVPI